MSSGLFHTHGPRLVELGYDIVPIKPGTKRPAANGWQKTDFGALLATPQGPRMFSGYGIGVKTKFIPAVDADTPSPWLVEQVYDWCAANIGPTLARIGQPPRELFVYRTETPFKKVKSDTFISPDGNEHKLEVLADGQQFVAYAIHPGTGKPYYWPDQELVDTPIEQLPVMTDRHAFALIDYVHRECAAVGWVRKAPQQQRSVVRRPTADPHAPLPLLAAAMAVVSIYPETYDRWIAIGAALYHATDGSAEALELWNTWSTKSDTYDGACCGKWGTFTGEARSGCGTVFYWADKAAPEWRRQPEVAAMFDALKAARGADTMTHKILNEKLRAVMSRVRK